MIHLDSLNNGMIYKKIGQNSYNIPKEHATHPDSIVPKVFKTVTENTSGKFTPYRDKAKELAKSMNISYNDALQTLYSRGEHAIDIIA